MLMEGLEDTKHVIFSTSTTSVSARCLVLNACQGDHMMQHAG